MTRALWLALAGGAASAMLFAGPITGVPGLAFLTLFAALPIAIAALSTRSDLAEITVAAGALPVALLGWESAVMYLAVTALPALGLGRLAVRTDGQGRPTPLGILVTAGTGLALGVLIAGLAWLQVRFGGFATGFQAVLESAGIIDQGMSGLTPEGAAQMERFVAVMPGLMASSWLAMHALNAALAQSLLVRRGLNARPPGGLEGLTLPLWVGVLAAATLVVATVAPDPWALLALNALAVLGLPMILLGLAVVHSFAGTRRSPAIWLVAVYALAILLGWPFAIIALLGLIDQWVGLRRHLGGGGPTS